MRAKGPAAAKAEEDRKKGLALFGPKPPTPKLLRAVGGNINRAIINKMKVTTCTYLFICAHIKAVMPHAKHNMFVFLSPGGCWRPVRIVLNLIFITPFWE